jgi:uncharacterized integral membrane protein
MDEPRNGNHREGPRWRLWGAAVAAVLFIIFVAQNSQEVRVDFLFVEATTPLVFALLLAGALGAVIGWLIPRIRRK